MNDFYIKAILDNSPESIVLIGKNHEVLAYNKMISEVLKLYFERDIKVNDLYYPDFVIDTSKELYLKTFEKAIKGESITVQNLTETEDVSIWFEYRMIPVYNENGDILGVSLSAKDITNEKKSQLKVIEVSERFKAVLDNTDESISLLDLNYKILAMNKVAIQTIKLNTNIDPLIGDDFRQFIPDKSSIFYKYYPKTCKGESFSIEISYQNFEGELIWYLTKFNTVFNEAGQQIGVSIFAKDITEKKKLEISLKESEERFRKITNLAPIGIIITNAKYKVTYANYTAKKLFKYEEQSIYSLYLNDLINNFSINEDNKFHVDNLQKAIETPIFNQEQFVAVNKNKTSFNVLLSSSSFISKDEQSYIFIIQDITDINQKDFLIADQHNKLRDIAWYQSHIIRAPLARIMGIISLMENQNPNEEEREFYYKTIIENSHELDQVIKDIVSKTV